MFFFPVLRGLSSHLLSVGRNGLCNCPFRRRVREIGIRMALGASNKDVVQMVLTDGLKPILVGVILGLAAALALSRVVSSLIFGVRATDPLTFAAVALLLLLVGIFATIVPACRATRIEPVRILREERSEEHTSELQSQSNLVCRLMLEKNIV